MKKFIRYILFFGFAVLIVVVIINFALSIIISKNDYYQLQYNEIIHPVVNADHIIIGTSHAVHGIQPEILNTTGHHFFNFAYDGANPEFYLKWYQNIFKPYYKKPAYVIIAVEWFLFNPEWLWRRYEHDAAYFPFTVFKQHILAGKKYNRSLLFNNQFTILKYRKSIIEELTNHDHYSYPISKYKLGFIPYQVMHPVVKEFYPRSININTQLQNQFETLLDLFNKDSIKMVLIQMPSFNSDAKIYESYPTGNYFKKMAAKYQASFIDYNTQHRTELNTDNGYYSDGGHMNEKGSIAFSKLLAEDLKKILK